MDAERAHLDSERHRRSSTPRRGADQRRAYGGGAVALPFGRRRRRILECGREGLGGDQPTRLDARDRGPVIESRSPRRPMIALTHHAHVFDSDTPKET